MLANPVYRGGLAPWQRRRTMDLIERHLRGDLSLARLAAECRLSTSYFCRCFRTSFGTSVHQFVIRCRVEQARKLLLSSSLSLAEIATEAGFSDQAAFSRTFASSVGTSPARWRAQHHAEDAALTTFPLRAAASYRSSLDFAYKAGLVA
ncbi:AraC family transcriptional regulator [Bryocella elongata]|uniref:AraC family transcriptional regulator n=1 Tax=Bryocella elongata TaxID=863522 RepID=A0A1H5VU64_9BACT|nr:AraC family transcriptional regulator [Bryocella elongata]SEF90673.1 AraC family transcriptional regulator [Bryocella elongata]